MRLSWLAPIALLLIACSSGTAATGSHSTSTPTPHATSSGGTGGVRNAPDACAILTQAQAISITGDSGLTKLTSNSSPASSICLYADTGGQGGGAEAVTESLPAVSQAAIVAAMASASHQGSNNTVTVSGLGDEAVKDVETNAATVAFAKGGVLVIITATGVRSGGAMDADIEALCHQVASTL